MKFDEDEFDYKIGKNVDDEAGAPGADGADNAADPAASAAFELRRLFKPDIDVNYDDPEDDIDADVKIARKPGYGARRAPNERAAENAAPAAAPAAAPQSDASAPQNAAPQTAASTQSAPAALKASKTPRRKGLASGGFGRAVITLLLTLLCIAIGIAAAMQYKTVVARASEKPDAEERITELLSTINTLHSELGSLEAERDELQNRLDLVEQSSQDEQLAALREELTKVQTFAGLTMVKGRGVHVQVSFDEHTNVGLIQSRLLLLINELRASGAQAISINGVRILAMTEIRVVDESYISVNALQLVAPYDIYAIGDAAKLYNGITMGRSGIVWQIRELTGATCTWETQENIFINAASEDDIKIDRLEVYK
ncbi:MAG: DUF881 domain-containing protein [Clostridia bacterium]|nr:DUF881 domain-containing protein [Clostridia bacterium]